MIVAPGNRARNPPKLLQDFFHVPQEIENTLGKVSLKNLFFSIGVGVFKAFVGGQIVSLAAKVGVIPDFNESQMMTEMCATVSKIDHFFFQASFTGPIVEELIMRYAIQEFLPKKILKNMIPGKETVLDSKVAAAARIVLTASLFASLHLLNKGIFPDSYCHAQVIDSFIGGMTYGALKESEVGLLGSIVAHMSNNILASVSTFFYC
ncbi:MAG: CPBP family intramembrane metalloprotease [Chlamydiales bacterium]|nr:CPBP family intramembrane metalloprotease [Chlamydiales bacterium]